MYQKQVYLKNVKPISLFWAVQWPKNNVNMITSFLMRFLAFLIIIRQYKCHLNSCDNNEQDRHAFKRKF